MLTVLPTGSIFPLPREALSGGSFYVLGHQFQIPSPLSLLYNLAGAGLPFMQNRQQALILVDRVVQKYS